jgi:PhnB protein
MSSGCWRRQNGDDELWEDRMPFHPYLTFGTNCREAFTRYQEIFGGDLFLMPMSEMPSEEAVPADQGDLIIHAALTLDGSLLMASDDPTGNGGTMQGMHVTYSVADTAEAERVFAALAEGGDITSPLAETFFSPRFGMCVDRFGTPWMVVADAPEQPA